MKPTFSCAWSRRSAASRATAWGLRLGLAVLVAAPLLVAPGPARAEIQSVTGQVDRSAVSIEGGSVSVTWRIQRQEDGLRAGTLPDTDTTRSNQVTVSVGGRTVLAQSSPFSRTSTLPAGGVETIVFREQIALPRSLARELARSPGAAVIARTFADSNNSRTGAVRVSVRAGQAGVQVLRLDLRFEDRARTQVVQRAAGLRAVVDVRTSGTGQFAGEWRVTAPDALRAGGRTRTLLQVRRPVQSMGQSRLRLVSPPLPTRLSGLYEVSFVVLQPQGSGQPAAIRYFVLPETLRDAPAIDLVAPSEGSSLTVETQFTWRAIPGAAAYQLEFYPGEDDNDPGSAPLLRAPADVAAERLSGRVVDAERTSTSLSRISLRRLPPGEAYRWRVVAFGPEGEVVGRSPLRTVKR